jgi:hypothetical protein
MRTLVKPERPRKAISYFVLGVLLFMAFAVGGGFGGRALGAATTITIISGDIHVRHGASGSFLLATDGQVLAAGDTVRTGEASRAVLTYFEGSTVSVEPNTELTIESASSSSDGSTIVVMRQSVGRTWHVVSKLLSGGSKYEVKTPASTASVRGTAFQVDCDSERTVITTSEGAVVARVADPDRLGQTVDVPVPAGKRHEQKKNARPAPVADAPQPERTLTLTVDGQNSLLIDAQGRTNGIDKSGKKRIETPGARIVKMDDGKLRIVLPNVSDGRLETQVRAAGGMDVGVRATVEQRGGEPVKVESKVRADTSGNGRANLDVLRTPDGRTNLLATPAPSVKSEGDADDASTGTSGPKN